jgi:N-methylhydantoinase B
VEAALALAPFSPGDAVLLNDPYDGGTHLPDLTCISPVFLDGRSQPSFFVASRAHHADVGGAAPGSLPIAHEVYEEGVRIPPVFVRRAGREQEGVLRLLLANVRTPHERRADLAAQLGAQVTGARRLAELAARDGATALEQAADALLNATERHAVALVRRLRQGTWRFETALDDDGLGHGPLPIRVKLDIHRGRVRADFTGTSPQAAGPVNAVRAVTRAAVLYAVRCVLGEDIAVNDGLLRVIDVIAPTGSLVDPRPPAAVGAGNVETSQRIVDTVLGAFSRALPGRVPAASSGTMNNLLIGGMDPRTGAPFAYYETLAGGHGAGPGWDGASAMQAHMTNTRNTPVESLEHAYPLRVLTTAIRRGSGGAGRWRGGEGIVRALELLAPARVTVISERRARGPYGLRGGGAGAPGSNRVALERPRSKAATGRVQRGSTRSAGRALPGKFQIDLEAGAVLTVASPGGGGYGRALRATSATGRAPRRRSARAPVARPSG